RPDLPHRRQAPVGHRGRPGACADTVACLVELPALARRVPVDRRGHPDRAVRAPPVPAGVVPRLMTEILHDSDADLDALAGRRVAVVGYGNQGRSWALNLRDSGLDVAACVRADETRSRAEADGFATNDVDAASDADVICLLIPDDVIPSVPVTPR